MPPYSGKRKREDYDSSDEEPLLGRQVLPIANLPDDFDGEPMDGAQYLFTVRFVRFLLPLMRLMKYEGEIRVCCRTLHGLKIRTNLCLSHR